MGSAGGTFRQPPLFGVVGLDRQPGVSGTLGVEESGGRRRRVMRSWCTTFRARDGSTVAVTSHPGGDNGDYETVRAWAPMNPYLATPRGREVLLDRSEGSTPLEPVAVDWAPVTIRVADMDLPFEACELDGRCWAAVGQVAGSIITLDGRGVPLDAIRLEEIEEHPVPDLPDLGAATAVVGGHLDCRFREVPFHRVHNWADYWALHSVEVDHVQRLRHLHHIPDDAVHALEAHWLARLDRQLADVLERLRHHGGEVTLNSPIARRLRGRDAPFQIWFNTIGPGARCWMSNRYTPIRQHTFRLRWRP
jgi:hypothetical protein